MMRSGRMVGSGGAGWALDSMACIRSIPEAARPCLHKTAITSTISEHYRLRTGTSLKMLTALPRQRVYISSELIRAEHPSMVTLLEINVMFILTPDPVEAGSAPLI